MANIYPLAGELIERCPDDWKHRCAAYASLLRKEVERVEASLQIASAGT